MATREETARAQALDFALEVMTNSEHSLKSRLSATELIVCLRQRCVACNFFYLPQVFLTLFAFQLTVSAAV